MFALHILPITLKTTRVSDKTTLVVSDCCNNSAPIHRTSVPQTSKKHFLQFGSASFNVDVKTVIYENTKSRNIAKCYFENIETT